MSYYDFWVVYRQCDRCNNKYKTECINYTSNVSKMWRDALGFSARYLDGMMAGAATYVIRHAVIKMRTMPKYYTAMNPSSGHGDYEGAKCTLERLLDDCEMAFKQDERARVRTRQVLAPAFW